MKKLFLSSIAFFTVAIMCSCEENEPGMEEPDSLEELSPTPKNGTMKGQVDGVL